MRHLTFGPDDAELFADLYGAFAVGERYLQGAKAIRSANKVYDTLEGIGEKIVRGEGQLPGWRLKAEGGDVRLEDADFEVLKQAVERVLDQGFNAMTAATQVVFRALDSRRAGRVLDLLEHAKTVERV
ncbi:MAG: hypothetical protein HY727_15145 [Candidatus Rokubacteria bacterium]|nr:hypothetical protein [Candidatus Rokubacteria bacterium]